MNRASLRVAFPLFAGIALLIACSEPQPSVDLSLLLDVPPPDLSRAEDPVRDQLDEAEATIERLRKTEPVDQEALGEAYGQLGLIHVTYGFVEAAEVAFDNARLLEPEEARWPYLEGYLHEIQGHIDEAVEALEASQALAPEDVPTLIRLGRVRLENGETDAAHAHFLRATELDPENAAGWEGLGRVAEARREPQEAISYFEKALELQPVATSLHHALGLAYRQVGDDEKAAFHIDRGGAAAVVFADPVLAPVTQLGRSTELFLVRAAQAFADERWKVAATLYERALELDPTDFTTRKAYGFTLEKLGDLEGAIAQLQEALVSGVPDDPANEDAEHSELHRILGGLRVLQGRDDLAIAAFSRAVELDPSQLDARLKLANALARQGRLQEALGHLDVFLSQQEDHARALESRATIRINLGDTAGARRDFERALAAAPDDAQLHLRWAAALDHLGDAAAARRVRAEAEALADDPTVKARLRAEAARATLRGGDAQGALEGFREAVALAPNDADLHYELAQILGHVEQLDDALAEFARVLELEPQHRLARQGEATVLVLQGRWTDARDRLKEGLDVLPRDRGLAHLLARILILAPDERARHPERGLQIAQRVHSVKEELLSAETLVLALAANGRYEEALAGIDELLPLAERGQRWQLAGRLQAARASFAARQPWIARSADDILTVLGG